MFANILRSRSRLALAFCKTRTPVSPISRLPSSLRTLPMVSPASRAISTSRPVWNGSGSVVGKPESNTLYAGNIPFSITEEELREKFEPFGEIKDLRLGYHPDGRSRGFCHVEFAQLGDAITAYDSFKEEPLFMLDRDIRIDYAGTRSRAVHNSSLTLYFHNFQGSMDNLREITGDFESSISNMFFLRNRETGEENGSGFIYFTTIDRAEEALKELNGRTSGDSVLNLRFAAPRRNPRERRRQNFRENSQENPDY